MATYTDEQFAKAVRDSKSVAEVLRTLGLKAAGGNYATVNNKVRQLGLDTDHWTGQSWSRGTVRGPRRPIDQLLVDGSNYKSHHLKKRLIAEGVFEAKCSRCKNDRWEGTAIPLELDHINGDRRDNRLANLRILCPNCHALTPTYRNNKR